MTEKEKNLTDQEPVTFGYVRQFDKEEAIKTRTIEFIFSTGAKDRHGTVLNMDNWQLENFNNNGIAGYQHNVYGGDLCNSPDPDDVIGVASAGVEFDVDFDGKKYDKALLGKITFEKKELNEKADKIFNKIIEGTLKAVSVGFVPIRDEFGKIGYYGDDDEAEGRQNETFYFFGQELLEISVVNIPANPEALQRSAHDQMNKALTYIMRQLGGEATFKEVGEMTVDEVIKQLRMSPDQRKLHRKNLKQIEQKDTTPSAQYYNKLKSRI